MDYKELRKKYPEFVYKKFEYKLADGNLECDFYYQVKPGLKFKHQVVVNGVGKGKFEKLNKDILDNLIFHIGLVEVPSYWKTTCSPLIKVEAGYLNQEQIDWWHKLFMNGMMQYFYTNKMDFRNDNFLRIEVEENLILKPFRQDQGKQVQGDNSANKGRYVNNIEKIKPLVTVGGGKDSVVTLELISRSFKEIGTLVIKPASESSYNVVKALGLKNVLTHERIFDKKLFELNKKGYLNGHIPYSAVLYFISILTAYIFEYSDILFSNENSSNEGNASYLGHIVNHQYSKTLEFENDFRDYNQRHLSNIRLFSFLRPLYEIQISKLFAEMPQYFDVIRSCNVGQQKGIWCGKCPKCLSTFVLLLPFLGIEKTVGIFGNNLLENKSLVKLLDSLLNEKEQKPFECVGTRMELKLALQMFKEAAGVKPFGSTQAKGVKVVPALLKHFVESEEYDKNLLESKQNEYLDAWGENNLPDKFAKMLLAKLNV